MHEDTSRCAVWKKSNLLAYLNHGKFAAKLQVHTTYYHIHSAISANFLVCQKGIHVCIYTCGNTWCVFPACTLGLQKLLLGAFRHSTTHTHTHVHIYRRSVQNFVSRQKVPVVMWH